MIEIAHVYLFVVFKFLISLCFEQHRTLCYAFAALVLLKRKAGGGGGGGCWGFFENKLNFYRANFM